MKKSMPKQSKPVDLEKSQEKFSKIFFASPAPMTISRLSDGHFLDVNDSYLRHTEYRREELLGKTAVELGIWISPEDRARFAQELKEHGFIRDFPTQYRAKSGRIGDILLSAELIELDGEPCLLGMSIDITERKRAEQVLSRNEYILRLFVENAPASIAMFDREMRYLAVSKRYLADNHLDFPDLVGRYHYEVVPEVPERWKEIHRRCLAGAIASAEEDPFPRADGRLDWVRWEIHPWYEKEGEVGGIILFSELITERVQAQAKLREQAAILDLAHVLIRDLDNHIIFWNKGAQKLYGWTEQEAVGQIAYDLLKTRFPVAEEEIEESLFISGEWEGELVHQTRAGSRLIVASHQVLYKDESGRPVAILEVNNDITAQKDAEEQVRKLNANLERRVMERTAQLQAANKELESFSYSVSHDLRAPLRAISGFSTIIARRHRSDLNAEGQHYVDNIVQASARMGQLIDDLLTYSRLGRSGVHHDRIPLDQVLADVRKDLQVYLDEAHGAVTAAEGLPAVSGDRTLLNQIFTNLLQNALIYHRAGIPPSIEIGFLDEGDQVQVSVKDNGIGIPSEHFEKIFNVFQRLHSEEEYPGTGIGLATVKKSIELLGGSIRVESQVGEGSTFFVRLPKE